MQNSIKYFETTDIASVENSDVKSIGAEHVVHETTKKLKVLEKYWHEQCLIENKLP